MHRILAAELGVRFPPKSRDVFVSKTCKSILELTHPNLKMGTTVSFLGDT
jgi:hypothetical protein